MKRFNTSDIFQGVCLTAGFALAFIAAPALADRPAAIAPGARPRGGGAATALTSKNSNEASRSDASRGGPFIAISPTFLTVPSPHACVP